MLPITYEGQKSATKKPLVYIEMLPNFELTKGEIRILIPVKSLTFCFCSAAKSLVEISTNERKIPMKKNTKLRVTTSCTDRIFYLLEAPPGRNDWHIRFTLPTHVRDRYAAQGMKIPKTIYRSTGQTEIEPAKAAARQMIEVSGREATVSPVPQEPTDFALLPEVMVRYRNGVVAPEQRTYTGQRYK